MSSLEYESQELCDHHTEECYTKIELTTVEYHFVLEWKVKVKYIVPSECNSDYITHLIWH